MSYLVECFACGREVSKSASACPHCGEPDFRAKDEATYLAIKKLKEERARLQKIVDRGREVEAEEREDFMKDVIDRLDRLAGDD